MSETHPLEEASESVDAPSRLLPTPPQRPDEIPYIFARRQGVLVTVDALVQQTRVLHKAGVPVSIFNELRRYLGQPFVMQEISEEEFDKKLSMLYESGSGQSTKIMETMGDDLDLDDAARALNQPEDLLDSEDDAPIIRLINALFTEAIKEEASDIHIEPYEHRLVVRFRVDGLLREVLHPPRNVAPYLISRIKVMAQLDIAEKRV
ncbi:ATPase, T2SS/T4P/T4SS family, partial [endosymbiont of Ridgeia piscesae]